jgi:predicted dehydrogenase
VTAKRRYAVVGVGSRSRIYTDAIAGSHAEHAELVALCDTNLCRAELRKRELGEAFADVPVYPAGDFERMVSEARPDVVIVTTVDVTHSDYIVRALELGRDVVTEKPMTTDAARCEAILRAWRDTGRDVQVTFNYRYAPSRSQVKELLEEGRIGRPLGVDFHWMLDTRHGADYFRRWHRHRADSGSLLVHKATHHFDLVNWWLGARPVEVFCRGRRAFYTPRTADELYGLTGRGDRCRDCPRSGDCPFFLDLAANAKLKARYLDCEHEDGYFRDRCVFGAEIDIWDTMSLVVTYDTGATMSYSLTAYCPVEGYSIRFNGDRGRLEHQAREKTYISGDGSVPGELEKTGVTITLIPAFSPPRSVEPRTGAGGHGGGDQPLLDDVFLPGDRPDPLGRRAGAIDGAWSILTGVAAAESIETGRPVRIDELVNPALMTQSDRGR